MNAGFHDSVILGLTFLLALSSTNAVLAEEAWLRHTVDRSSLGADGVRLADANGDSLLDVVTGWEEGGKVRLCLNPGPEKVREPWPSVTIGSAQSVEDAVLVDLDGDGCLDVVSACEGTTRTLQFHWAPTAADLLKPETWQTQALVPSTGQTCWMFTLPWDIDGRFGLDLMVGSKNPNGVIGWFQAPRAPRLAEEWAWHPLRPAGWIMSLIKHDMDGDGDLDLLFSDRRGAKSGCYWLERPAKLTDPWAEHLVGAAGREVLFISQADLNRDGRMEILAAIKPRAWARFECLDNTGLHWRQENFVWPRQAGGPKAVVSADINGDARPDLVGSCEGASDRSGVFWLDFTRGISAEPQFHDISGPVGTKYDLVELIDLDADGDLDVLTCEEKENLGVVWYENRLKPESKLVIP